MDATALDGCLQHVHSHLYKGVPEKAFLFEKHKRYSFKYRDSRIYVVEMFLRSYSDRRLVRERVDYFVHQ